MTLQLSPVLPVDTPKGKGFAHFLIDYSQEHDLHWVVFLDESGECWTFNNREVRMQKNITLGRTFEAKEAKEGAKTRSPVPFPRDA